MRGLAGEKHDGTWNRCAVMGIAAEILASMYVTCFGKGHAFWSGLRMICPKALHLIGLTEEDMMAGTRHAAVDCPVKDGYIQRCIKDAAVANPWVYYNTAAKCKQRILPVVVCFRHRQCCGEASPCDD